MSDKSLFVSGRVVWRRRLAGLAGVATGCSTLAAVAVLYAEAASMTWLPPTPLNLASLQRCDVVHGTAARHACVEAAIERVRSRGTETRLAARPLEPSATRPPN